MMTQAVKKVEHRISLALSRRPVIPALALKYRLCEVGSRRIDPRALDRALPILTKAGDVVVRTDEGLYARSDLAANELAEQSAAAHRMLERLDLTVLGYSRDQSHIAEAATRSLRAALDDAGWQTDTQAGGASPHVFRIRRPRGASPLLVRLLAEEDWVHPDTHEIWAHARVAREIGAHPVYLARKVAPMTFPLLSVLKVRALQFYDLLTAATPDVSARGMADTLGLPKLRAATELPVHAVFTQLLNLIAERPDESWSPGASTAFDEALVLKFDQAPITTTALTAWAQQNLLLPQRWVEAVQASGEGNSYTAKRPRTRSRSNDTKRETATSGVARRTEKSRVPFRI
jgi:hypothetical protein